MRIFTTLSSCQVVQLSTSSLLIIIIIIEKTGNQTTGQSKSDRIKWKLLMWEVKLQHWENTPRNQVEDQQTQPTYYPTSKNQTWVTLVGGRHTHRCTSPLSTVLTRLHSHRLLNSIKICVFLGTAFSPLASYLIYLFFYYRLQRSWLPCQIL